MEELDIKMVNVSWFGFTVGYIDGSLTGFKVGCNVGWNEVDLDGFWLGISVDCHENNFRSWSPFWEIFQILEKQLDSTMLPVSIEWSIQWWWLSCWWWRRI